jgi:hypothetical protein
LAAFAAGAARADATLSGVCPDGSVFIVQSRASIPCADPKLADASELPPVRPYLLPRPYTWYVDQEARNPNNPYNLIEAARKIRAARQTPADETAAARAPSAAPRAALAPPPAPQATRQPVRSFAEAPRSAVALADDELRDLVRLIALRQSAAPAQLAISDVRGASKLAIQLAYSASFESYALAALGKSASESRVLVFDARAELDADFQPNFLIVQDGRTFRPDPQSANELGFVLGGPGSLPAGELAAGYLVVPASFDPSRSLELFWNDRSVAAVLAPADSAATH